MVYKTNSYREDSVACSREVKKLSKEDIGSTTDGRETHQWTTHMTRASIIHSPCLIGLVHNNLKGERSSYFGCQDFNRDPTSTVLQASCLMV